MSKGLSSRVSSSASMADKFPWPRVSVGVGLIAAGVVSAIIADSAALLFLAVTLLIAGIGALVPALGRTVRWNTSLGDGTSSEDATPLVDPGLTYMYQEPPPPHS